MFDMKHNNTISSPSKGLTLLELLITIAIVSILLTSVGPNIQSILTTNRITADINDLSSIMRFARHTAINEETVTLVCPTTDFSDCSDDWTQPKMVFIDTDGNGSRDEDEVLAASSNKLSSSISLSGIEGTFSFAEDGTALGARTMLFCPDSNDDKFAKALLITAYGKISISTDSNGDGIAEDANDANLSCSS